MDEWTFDPVVADAILRTRKLGLTSLRETAEYAFDTRLGDADWAILEPIWRWHDAMTSDELEERLKNGG